MATQKEECTVYVLVNITFTEIQIFNFFMRKSKRKRAMK